MCEVHVDSFVSICIKKEKTDLINHLSVKEPQLNSGVEEVRSLANQFHHRPPRPPRAPPQRRCHRLEIEETQPSICPTDVTDTSRISVITPSKLNWDSKGVSCLFDRLTSRICSVLIFTYRRREFFTSSVC